MNYLHEIIGSLVDEEVSYVPNRGNRGDALVAASVARCLGKNGTRVSRDASCVVVAGGGGLHPLYSCLSSRLRKTPRGKRLVVMPSTVSAHWDLLKTFSNLLLLARDSMTLDLARMHGINVMPCHDAAFSYEYPSHRGGGGILRAFRNDREAHGEIPDDNVDFIRGCGSLFPLSSCATTAFEFVDEIAGYDEVETNFTHIAIAASKMGIPVKFHPGSYFKNRAIYEASLASNPLVQFVG